MSLTPRTSRLLARDGVAHGFFTRTGGVSKGIYKSLNCGPGSADAPAAIAENRKRVARHLGGDGACLNTLYQIHSGDVVVIDRPLPPGNVTRADALVTKEKGLILGVLTADCAPILLCDPDAGIIAAAHAGWRGALAGILANTVAAMLKLGAGKSRIRAVVGPAIGKDSYEVGGEFRAAFVTVRDDFAGYFCDAGSGQSRFDLERFALDRLRETGIARVAGLGLDTYAAADEFFSYRRACHLGEADYGRQISAIVLG